MDSINSGSPTPGPYEFPTTSNSTNVYAKSTDFAKWMVQQYSSDPGPCPTPEESRTMQGATLLDSMPPGSIYVRGSHSWKESWGRIHEAWDSSRSTLRPEELWEDAVRELSSVYATLTKWLVETYPDHAGYKLFATIDGRERLVSLITQEAYENERDARDTTDETVEGTRMTEHIAEQMEAGFREAQKPEARKPRFREASTLMAAEEKASPTPLCLRRVGIVLDGRGMPDRADSDEYTLVDENGRPFTKLRVRMDTKTIMLDTEGS